MSTYQQKDNTGVLFRNTKKESEKHPDYTGNLLINGKPMRMSAWVKEGTKGKYMSIQFQEPYDKPDSKDDMPF